MSELDVTVRQMRAGDLDAVARFIADVNRSRHDHVKEFDLVPVGVLEHLRALRPPAEVGFWLAEGGDGRIVGALGIEWDAGVQEGWLQGPMVSHPRWGAVADALMAPLRACWPETLGRVTLGVDELNTRAGQFAVRHGFVRNPYTNVHMILGAPGLRVAPPPAVVQVDDRLAPALIALHSEVFPQGHFSGEELASWRDDDMCTTLVYRREGALRGYVTGRVDTRGEVVTIDFIAVAEAFRRQGVGEALLAAISEWAFSGRGATPGERFERAHIQWLALTVRSNRPGAIALYNKLGFERESSFQGYVWRVNPTAPQARPLP